MPDDIVTPTSETEDDDWRSGFGNDEAWAGAHPVPEYNLGIGEAIEKEIVEPVLDATFSAAGKAVSVVESVWNFLFG